MISKRQTKCSGRLFAVCVEKDLELQLLERKCTNYRGIPVISVPGKVYAKCLEKKCREIAEPKLTDAQCGFRPGRSTMDQIFALQQIFEKSWEYAKRSMHVLLILKKHMIAFLETNFGRCCCSMALMASY